MLKKSLWLQIFVVLQIFQIRNVNGEDTPKKRIRYNSRAGSQNGNKRTNLRVHSFEDFMLLSDTYVDKSLLINEICSAVEGTVFVINRPPGFGKSFNLNMMKRFFEKTVDANGTIIPLKDTVNYELFAGGEVSLGNGDPKTLRPLNIVQYENVTYRYFGEYPVIYFDFGAIEDIPNGNVNMSIAYSLISFFNEYSYLERYINEQEKEDLEEIMCGDIGFDQVQFFLRFLSQILYRYFRRRSFIFIDNYDFQINKAYAECSRDGNFEHFHRVLSLFEDIYAYAFKNNPFLEKGVLAGVLPLFMSDFFPKLKSATVLTLFDRQFSEYYGFSDTDVQKLLADCKLESKYNEIENWYKGYNFCGHPTYNPHSIVSCIEAKGKISNYDSKTDILLAFEDIFLLDDMQEEMRKLVRGYGLIKIIHRTISKTDLENRKAIFYSVLTFSGYLNAVPVDNSEPQKYNLRIPNKEIKETYIHKLETWICGKLSISNYRDFVNLLTSGNVDAFEKALKEHLKTTNFFLFYRTTDVYSLMAGILLPLHSKYIIKSNECVKDGRYGHVVISKEGTGSEIKPKVAILLEYMKPKMDLLLNEPAGVIVNQTIGHEYDEEIKQHGHIEEVVKVVLAIRRNVLHFFSTKSKV